MTKPPRKMLSDDVVLGLTQVGTRLDGMEQDYTDLKAVVGAIDRKLDHSVRELSAKFDATMAATSTRFDTAIASITTKFDERNRTPWGIIFTALGVVLTVCIAVGTLAMMPVREGLGDQKAAIRQITQTMLSREEAHDHWQAEEALRSETRFWLTRELDRIHAEMAHKP